MRETTQRQYSAVSSSPPVWLWDTLAATICLLAGAACLWEMRAPEPWTQAEGSAFLPATGLSRAGRIRADRSGSRVMHEDSSVWWDLPSGSSEVFWNDSVFSGRNSDTTLKLESGGEVTLAPESLIVLRKPVTGVTRWPGFELRQGQLSLRATSTAHGPFQVAVGGRTYGVSLGEAGSSAEISIEPGGKSPLIRSGRTPIRVSQLSKSKITESIELAPGEALSGAPGAAFAPHSPAFQLRLPKEREVKVWRPGRNVEFTWQPSSSTLKPFSASRLEIEGPQAAIIPVDAGRSEGSAALAPGTYRWRVMPVQGPDLASEWRALTVVALAPPDLDAPLDQATALIDANGKAPVRFLWENENLFTIELELESEGSAARTLPGTARGVSMELAPGRYRWHARAKLARAGKDDVISNWSPSRLLTVADHAPPIQVATSAADLRPAPAAAAPLAAASTAKAQPEIKLLPAIEAEKAVSSTRFRRSEDLDTIALTLKWRDYPTAKRYDVTVFRKDGAVLSKVSTEVPHLTLTLDSLDETEFTYQVEAALKDGAATRSRRMPIRIELSAPVEKSPSDGAIYGARRAVILTWERTSVTHDYQIQVATDPAFHHPVFEKTTRGNIKIFTPPRPGKFYWRVKSLHRKHESAWSAARSFTVRAS